MGVFPIVGWFSWKKTSKKKRDKKDDEWGHVHSEKPACGKWMNIGVFWSVNPWNLGNSLSSTISFRERVDPENGACMHLLLGSKV